MEQLLNLSALVRGLEYVSGPITLVAFAGLLWTIRAISADRTRSRLAKQGQVDVIATVIQSAPGFALDSIPEDDRKPLALEILRQQGRRRWHTLVFWSFLAILFCTLFLVIASRSGKVSAKTAVPGVPNEGIRLADLSLQIAMSEGKYSRGVETTVRQMATELVPSYDDSKSNGPTSQLTIMFIQDANGMIKLQRIHMHDGAKRVRALSSQVVDDVTGSYYADKRAFQVADDHVFHEATYQSQSDYPYFALPMASESDVYVVAIYKHVCMFDEDREHVGVEVEDYNGIGKLMLAVGGELVVPSLAAGYEVITAMGSPIRLEALGERASNVTAKVAVEELRSTFGDLLAFLSKDEQDAYKSVPGRASEALLNGAWTAVEVANARRDVHYVVTGRLAFDRSGNCADESKQ